MILKRFYYQEFMNDKERFWAVSSFELNKINLFVAKNATGKTRMINAINSLGTMILGRVFRNYSDYSVEFSDTEDVYQYIHKHGNSLGITEKLIINRKEFIVRHENGEGEMYAAGIGGNVKFQLPKTALAVSRRDLLQQPYLEKLNSWAENVHLYSFGTTMNQEKGINTNIEISGLSNIIAEVFLAGFLEFGKIFQSVVLTAMNKLNYDLTDIGLQEIKIRNINSESHTEYKLIARERDRKANITQIEMSQGMFRALSIIIHLTYHNMMKIPATILIDDIGEGLDFERSTKLIKLLIELAEQNDNIQLIMSTNDRFVMNAVPLEYWQVIQRKGGECQVSNYKNEKEKFDEFEFTGLNNFDFLRTDFINSNREPV